MSSKVIGVQGGKSSSSSSLPPVPKKDVSQNIVEVRTNPNTAGFTDIVTGTLLNKIGLLSENATDKSYIAINDFNVGDKIAYEFNIIDPVQIYFVFTDIYSHDGTNFVNKANQALLPQPNFAFFGGIIYRKDSRLNPADKATVMVEADGVNNTEGKLIEVEKGKLKLSATFTSSKRVAISINNLYVSDFEFNFDTKLNFALQVNPGMEVTADNQIIYHSAPSAAVSMDREYLLTSRGWIEHLKELPTPSKKLKYLVSDNNVYQLKRLERNSLQSQLFDDFITDVKVFNEDYNNILVNKDLSGATGAFFDGNSFGVKWITQIDTKLAANYSFFSNQLHIMHNLNAYTLMRTKGWVNGCTLTFGFVNLCWVEVDAKLNFKLHINDTNSTVVDLNQQLLSNCVYWMNLSITKIDDIHRPQAYIVTLNYYKYHTTNLKTKQIEVEFANTLTLTNFKLDLMMPAASDYAREYCIDYIGLGKEMPEWIKEIIN